MTITLDNVWLYNIIPVLALIAVVYTILGFAFWLFVGKRNQCEWRFHDDD